MPDSHEIDRPRPLRRDGPHGPPAPRELLRVLRDGPDRDAPQPGLSYREVEDSGHFLVIIDIGCKFKKPAYYDDLLTVRTTVARVTHVKIVHEYQVFRDGVLLAEGHSTLACVDREGKPQALPAILT